MNKGGLANKGGEIIKELDELLLEIAPLRKEQATAKFNFEDVQERLNDFTSFLYHQIQSDTGIDWENPNPILTTEGTPMPDFEDKYRSMMMSSLIQQNATFKDLSDEQSALKTLYYEKETEVVTRMERIGVLRTELGAIGALARLATDES